MTTNIPPTPPGRNSQPTTGQTPQISEAQRLRIEEEQLRLIKQDEELSAKLQKSHEAGVEFKAIQDEAKQTNAEVTEHNETMDYRRRLMLIVAGSLITLGIVLKVLEVTIMGGW